MKLNSSPGAEHGATLVVGLIMLVLITLLVSSAFNLSTGNLKAVGNNQLRNEAIAAANVAIDRQLRLFINGSVIRPSADTFQVDIDNDGNADYSVAVALPECISATVASTGSLSSVTLPASMSASDFWNTVWDIRATASNVASGTSVVVRSGVRIKLSDAQKTLLCI